MAEGSLVLKGVIDNVVFYNSDNDYAVLEIVDENELLIIAVGNMSIPFEGERVALYGKWGRHKEFGKQFCFDSYEKTLPCEVEGILQYLSSRAVKGIGPITARKIVERFGVDSFDIIENHPEWLTDISGITMKKAAKISQSFVEQSGLRNISMALKDYITSAEAVKVYKKYGPSAMGIVRGNPYLLCSDECGIPFVKVDLLARSLGVDPESKNRMFSGITYILQHNANINGHTCLPVDKLVDDTSKLLGVCTDKISSDISVFISDGSLCEFTANYVKYVMTKKTSESEEYVVKKIRQLTSQIIRFSASDVASIIQNAEAHRDTPHGSRKCSDPRHRP